MVGLCWGHVRAIVSGVLVVWASKGSIILLLVLTVLVVFGTHCPSCEALDRRGKIWRCSSDLMPLPHECPKAGYFDGPGLRQAASATCELNSVHALGSKK